MAIRDPGKLRIIGGTHRSRVIEFDPKSGVRPTPDRVRQTLFDWLAPLIDGAKCLDLFAGSGALGLEAISRGANKVVFAESARRQTELIRANLAKLKEEARAEVMPADGITYLELTPLRFDVVFLDPPFDSDLLMRALPLLPQRLAPVNRIYLEWREGAKPVLPAGFVWLREKQAGQVCFGLVSFEKPHA
ncbi:MAG: 16S rRNA (guanine(966)-N(2))-methyltransferase RsmD [Pseudomonadota bacterium]